MIKIISDSLDDTQEIATAIGGWTFGPTVTDTSKSTDLSTDKENMLNTFKQLDSISREELIKAIRVQDAAKKLVSSTSLGYWFNTPVSRFDQILSTVSLEDLESVHAQLLLEEEIK